MTRNVGYCLLCLSLFVFAGCSQNHEQAGPQIVTPNVAEPPQVVIDPQMIATIENAFGSVDRDANGTIVAVDLARARSSANDNVLNAALSIHGLKKLRVAGSAISRETLAGIAKQTQLQELFLQDTVIQDDDVAAILAALPELKRLTLRRCANVTDQAAQAFHVKKDLRNLALIEMNVGRETLESLSHSQSIVALDLRDCSRITQEDYALLMVGRLTQLTDLKIGGFTINDSVLEFVAKMPKLIGLTIEDAMISPDAFAKMLETSVWKTQLRQLVLSRNTTLFDVGLSPIQYLPKLKYLTVNGMMVTGTFLTQLAENESARPHLETLALQKSFLTVDGAKALQKFTELKSLDLSGIAMTEELVEIIVTLGTLETLNLSECRLTNEMVKPIRNMSNVTSLILAGNPISVE